VHPFSTGVRKGVVSLRADGSGFPAIECIFTKLRVKNYLTQPFSPINIGS